MASAYPLIGYAECIAHIDEANLATVRFVRFQRTLRSQLPRLSDRTLFLMFASSRLSSANWRSTKGHCVLIDVSGTILQMSVSALTVAAKGGRDKLLATLEALDV